MYDSLNVKAPAWLHTGSMASRMETNVDNDNAHPHKPKPSADKVYDALCSALEVQTNTPDIFIYFIRGQMTRHIKIGVAADVLLRMATLQTASPDKLGLLGVVNSTQGLERMLHNILKPFRLHGEWFEHNEGLVLFIKNKAHFPIEFAYHNPFSKKPSKVLQKTVVWLREHDPHGDLPIRIVATQIGVSVGTVHNARRLMDDR